MPAGIATFTKSFITKPTIKMTKTDTNVRQLLRDRYFKKEGDKVLTAIETAEDILTGRNAIQKMLMEMVETIADTKKTIERQVGNIEDAVHDNDKQFVIKSFNILKSLETQMKAKEIVAFVDGVEVLNAIHINMNKAVEKKSA